MPLSPPVALRFVKLLHTAAWALFAGLILVMPLLAWQRRFVAFAIAAIVVAGEAVVIVLNGMKCPLTPIAARYTTDRRDNFDIYLPLLLARYNKHIFGPLYFGALLFGLGRWLTV